MIVDQDLLVQARFRNAVLWEKMAGRTAAEVCREIGVGQSEFGAYLNLKDSPISAKGGYRPGAQKIADHFRMLPEDLFPASLYALTLPKTFERTYSSEAVLLSLGCSEARQLTTGDDMDEKLDMESLHEHVQQVLGTLRPREEKIITMRFGLDGNGEHTLEEVGRVFNVTRDRIRQLEARALRKLRHPACSQELRPFIEGLD